MDHTIREKRDEKPEEDDWMLIQRLGQRGDQKPEDSRFFHEPPRVSHPAQVFRGGLSGTDINYEFEDPEY